VNDLEQLWCFHCPFAAALLRSRFFAHQGQYGAMFTVLLSYVMSIHCDSSEASLLSLLRRGCCYVLPGPVVFLDFLRAPVLKAFAEVRNDMVSPHAYQPDNCCASACPTELCMCNCCISASS
jgi:hypothetical protein